ncbi:AP complex subunit beta, partial [Kipferlia bialata]|eukprot:g11001.t1
MADAKYFKSTKRGQVAEWAIELRQNSAHRKRVALKKIIAAMTVGRDVSPLFTDVLNNIQTKDLELKKLVYLYLVNYARHHPKMTIMAVNTFVKDAEDPENPLIRALAIRTMGCIRVDEITEYIAEPLRRAIRDQDPYVRKTAALCVAKLYDVNADLCVSQGFVTMCQELLTDGNQAVVANAVAALTDIMRNPSSPKDVLRVSQDLIGPLLSTLNE